MDCKGTSERLGAYLDGELSRADAAAVEQHLQGCPPCAAALAELRALGRALEALEGAAVPADFAARVREAAEARRQPIMLFAWQRVKALNGTLMRVAAVLVAAAGLWVGVSVGGSAFGAPQAAGGETAAEQSELDVHLSSLSATPPGSIAEAYLAFGEASEEGGSEQ